ncbi:MAG: ATPase domain-containing protein [Candidatus Micrarchaeia archaeon]
MFPRIRISKVEKAKTGIPGLDELIEGGINRGSVVSVTGETGTGKTTFATQFLYKGAAEYGEPGLFISFEESKGILYRNMARFGWDLDELERKRKFVFIEYPLTEVEQFAAQENVIRNLVDTIGVERIAIDSISALALTWESEKDRRQGLLKIMDRLRKWGCTSIVTAESEGEVATGTPRTKHGAEWLSDGLIHLYNIRKGNYRERALEVVKLRGVSHECKIIPMSFTSKGLALHPTKLFYSE